MTGPAALAITGSSPVSAVSEALLDYLRRAVTVVCTRDGQGSGVVWTTDGLVVTNDHVAHEDEVMVELADGRRSPGAVIARDRLNDLAAIRLPVGDLHAAVPGDSRTLRIGELLFAVGHPLGIRDTATLGIVSGVGMSVWRGRHRCDLLQADIQLLPGNSGGPLADTSGRVVGIASMVISPGIALAVPTHVVQEFVGGLTLRRRTDAGRTGA